MRFGFQLFIFNYNKLSHGLTPFRETVGVTGETNTIVTCKGTLHLLLKNNTQHLFIQVKNVPCIESNPHDGFPLLPFCDYGSKQSIHSEI